MTPKRSRSPPAADSEAKIEPSRKRVRTRSGSLSIVDGSDAHTGRVNDQQPEESTSNSESTSTEQAPSPPDEPAGHSEQSQALAPVPGGMPARTPTPTTPRSALRRRSPTSARTPSRAAAASTTPTSTRSVRFDLEINTYRESFRCVRCCGAFDEEAVGWLRCGHFLCQGCDHDVVAGRGGGAVEGCSGCLDRWREALEFYAALRSQEDGESEESDADSDGEGRHEES